MSPASAGILSPLSSYVWLVIMPTWGHILYLSNDAGVLSMFPLMGFCICVVWLHGPHSMHKYSLFSTYLYLPVVMVLHISALGDICPCTCAFWYPLLCMLILYCLICHTVLSFSGTLFVADPPILCILLLLILLQKPMDFSLCALAIRVSVFFPSSFPRRCRSRPVL